jgi:hypothetical protein
VRGPDISPRIAAIIPLGHGSRRGSSGLPEGCSSRRLAPSQRERVQRNHRRTATARTLTRRAGPALPSYLALHHAGFSMPRVLPRERWALTPPFHPCQTTRAVRRRLAGLPARCHRAACRRRYFFCGTFRERIGRRKPKSALPELAPLALPGALPFTLVGPKPTKGSLMTQDGVRTFLPPGHLSMARPAITRPARHSHYSPYFARIR